MRKLIEVTFMSIDGVIDAPDIVEEAKPYISSAAHASYQKEHLWAADALLLGRKTYEKLSKAYMNMARSGGEGVPMDLVARMNAIPKYVASTTLRHATWNAIVFQGDVAEEVRALKNQPGKDILKYGTGPLDHVLFRERLVDLLCLVVYPFVLGHGTHVFERFAPALHMRFSNVRRFESGSVVMEYAPKQTA